MRASSSGKTAASQGVVRPNYFNDLVGSWLFSGSRWGMEWIGATRTRRTVSAFVTGIFTVGHHFEMGDSDTVSAEAFMVNGGTFRNWPD